MCFEPFPVGFEVGTNFSKFSDFSQILACFLLTESEVDDVLDAGLFSFMFGYVGVFLVILEEIMQRV